MTSTISFRTGLQRILSSFSPSARSRIWRRHRHRPLCQARTLRSLLSEASSPKPPLQAHEASLPTKTSSSLCPQSLYPSARSLFQALLKDIVLCPRSLSPSAQSLSEALLKDIILCPRSLSPSAQSLSKAASSSRQQRQPIQSSQQLSSAAPAYPIVDASLLSSFCTTSSPSSQHLLSAAANESYCTTSSPSSQQLLSAASQRIILSYNKLSQQSTKLIYYPTTSNHAIDQRRGANGVPKDYCYHA